MWKRLAACVAEVRADQRGAIAVQFAFLLVPIAVLTFGAIDISQTSLQKRQLQDALDAATLMAARSTAITNTDLEKIGDSAMEAEMVNSGIEGIAAKTTFVAGTGNMVIGEVKNVAIDSIILNGGTVNARSEVARSIDKLEIVMVLDNTGSMAGTKLTNLKLAANNFIETLKKAAARSSEPDAVKIGIVPFGSTVRLGSATEVAAYATQDWMDKTGASPINGEIFNSPANRFTLLKNMNVTWGGCVESRPYKVGGVIKDFDITDVEPNPAVPATLFVPYFWPDEPDSPQASSYKNGDFKAANSYLVDKVYSKTNWKIPQGEVSKYNKAPSSGAGPNTGCTIQPLKRLTKTWDDLHATVNAMTAVGETHIPIGAMWGWHVLSAKPPFKDGSNCCPTCTVPCSKLKVRKIAVIMTDGENTYNTTTSSNTSNYDGYGYIWQGRLGITSGSTSTRTTAIDNRLAALCENMKKDGITIYTVRVEVSTGSSSLLKACASEEKMFYDVQSASQMDAVFNAIAGSIQNLRIAK